MLDKLAHIRAQIGSMAGRFSPKEEHDGIKIRCPFHAGGNERTPSCKVRTTGNIGRFHCFGCHESGDWNKLCEATGMQGFKKADQVNDVFSFVIPEERYSDERPDLEDIRKLRPAKLPAGWRSITAETLLLFDARFPKHEFYNQNDFLYFPVTNNKRYVGGVYARRVVDARTKELGLISYINTKGVWTKRNLFGYDLAKKRKGPLWYVEGPRDAMKIAQLGGRVVAGLGSYVGPHKLRLIEALDPDALIIGTDPDDAGKKARAFIHENMTMLPCIDAIFPEGRDPANFTQKSFNKMMMKLGFGDYVKEAA